MHKIEYVNEVKFGESVIDSIAVAPLTFIDMTKLWDRANKMPGAYEVEMQRLRILHQTHFKAGEQRVVPDAPQLAKLPRAVAAAIIAALDEGNGPMGSQIGSGDGIITPVHIKLGTPVEMLSNGKSTKIEELEFMAETYGEVEDVLAADGELAKSLALLRTLAVPVGVPLNRLPGWALDRITPADGLLVMRQVLPRF